MHHKLIYSDLTGFEYNAVLASSTAEGKKLVMKSTITQFSTVVTRFEVHHGSKILCDIPWLGGAMRVYNTIDSKPKEVLSPAEIAKSLKSEDF